MSDNIKRIVKNVLIALLLVSAGVLTWLNWFSDPPKVAGQSGTGFEQLIGALTGRETAAQQSASYAEYEEFAYTVNSLRPAIAAIHTQDEFYLYTTRADVAALFDRALVSLATALDTAVDGTALTDADWRESLIHDVLYLQFSGDMPLYYFAAALGAVQNEEMDHAVRHLLLDFTGDTVHLLVKTADGEIYSYTTGLRGLNTEILIADAQPIEAGFACQNVSTRGTVPDETILLDHSILVPQLGVSPALTDFTGSNAERMIENVLDSFGFNTYSVNSYIESDGTRVYVEEIRTLRIMPDGTLVFDNGAEDELKPISALAMNVRTQNINKSAQVIEQAITPYLGEASAYILRQYHDEVTGNYVVVFSVEYAGMKIHMPSGYLARFEFRATELVKAYVSLCTFSAGEGSDTLLPSVYAAAAVGTAQTFEVRYTVRGNMAKAAWYHN